MKQPSLIEDDRLRNEVIECINCDDNYSPLVDKVRHATGLEYEYILQEKLINLEIPFLNEDQLRDKSYTKTPDVKLILPVLISGQVVNWIESKASFGDEYSHQMNSKQFQGYKNRFGPGLVIYWFGFIDELQQMDPDILLMDEFPSNIITMQLPKVKEEDNEEMKQFFADIETLQV